MSVWLVYVLPGMEAEANIDDIEQQVRCILASCSPGAADWLRFDIEQLRPTPALTVTLHSSEARKFLPEIRKIKNVGVAHHTDPPPSFEGGKAGEAAAKLTTGSKPGRLHRSSPSIHPEQSSSPSRSCHKQGTSHQQLLSNSVSQGSCEPHYLTSPPGALKQTASSETESSQPCRLFALPQELQDLIFDLAYPAEPDGTFYINREDWCMAQRWLLSPGNGYEAKPFPAPKVASLMVSKRFFVAAAKAWVRHQTCGPEKQFSTFGPPLPLQKFTQGIVPAFVEQLLLGYTFRWSHVCTEYRIAELPNLKSLKLILICGAVGALEVLWSRELDDADFATVARDGLWPLLDELGVLGRLQEILVECRPPPSPSKIGCSCSRSNHSHRDEGLETAYAEAVAMWTSNVKAFELYLNSCIAGDRAVTAERRPERTGYEGSALEPLYLRSQVCWGTHSQQVEEKLRRSRLLEGYRRRQRLERKIRRRCFGIIVLIGLLATVLLVGGLHVAIATGKLLLGRGANVW
ncbi:hypothetical protein LTR85_007773 [Meristemomyces frigidus]|nr:hypothetical protein LTR85_007773 [Meristemomyces frigidus]